MMIEHLPEEDNQEPAQCTKIPGKNLKNVFFLEQFMTTIVLVDSSLTLFVRVSKVSKTLGGKGGRADDYKGDDLPMYQILILSFFCLMMI